MSNKKSYMNYKKILSESVLKDFMKYFNIIKKFKFSGLSKDEKQLLKSPNINNIVIADCTGFCGGDALELEYYLDSDGDGLADACEDNDDDGDGKEDCWNFIYDPNDEFEKYVNP